jgi:hypothetical protein
VLTRSGGRSGTSLQAVRHPKEPHQQRERFFECFDEGSECSVGAGEVAERRECGAHGSECFPCRGAGLNKAYDDPQTLSRILDGRVAALGEHEQQHLERRGAGDPADAFTETLVGAVHEFEQRVGKRGSEGLDSAQRRIDELVDQAEDRPRVALASGEVGDDLGDASLDLVERSPQILAELVA